MRKDLRIQQGFEIKFSGENSGTNLTDWWAELLQQTEHTQHPHHRSISGFQHTQHSSAEKTPMRSNLLLPRVPLSFRSFCSARIPGVCKHAQLYETLGIKFKVSYILDNCPTNWASLPTPPPALVFCSSPVCFLGQGFQLGWNVPNLRAKGCLLFGLTCNKSGLLMGF